MCPWYLPWGGDRKIGICLKDGIWGRNSTSGGLWEWDNKMEWVTLVGDGSVKRQAGALEGRNSADELLWRRWQSREAKKGRVEHVGNPQCWEPGHGPQGAAPSPGPALSLSIHSIHSPRCVSSLNLPSLFCITDCLLNGRYNLHKIINRYSRSCLCPSHNPFHTCSF